MKRVVSSRPDSLVPPARAGWANCTLGELGIYRNGRGFKKTEWADSGRPIIRIQNLTGTGEAFNYFKGTAAPEHVVRDGDLLISWAATLGVYFWHGPEAVLNQHIFRVDSYINRRFHALRVQGLIEDFYRRAHGSGMVHITRGEFDGTAVVLPPEREQQRIVDEVEKQFTRLDAAVAGLQRVKANLKRYRASVLKAACEGRLVPTEAELARREGRSFEAGEELLKRILKERRARWEEDQLAKMTATGHSPWDSTWKTRYREPADVEAETNGAVPEGWTWANWDQLSRRVTVGHVGPMKHEYVADGIPFLRSQNVRPNRFDTEGLLHISPEFHAKLAKSTLMPGDVVIVRSGSVGVACVVPEALGEANCSDLVLVQCPLMLLPQFGCFYMNSTAKRRVSRGQVGVALAHFNTASVASLPVPLPPLSEQHRIVAEVERRLSVVDELEATVEMNLARCVRLRQSILKVAFEGRLVPQDPNDEPADVLLERIRRERESADVAGAPPRRRKAAQR